MRCLLDRDQIFTQHPLWVVTHADFVARKKSRFGVLQAHSTLIKRISRRKETFVSFNCIFAVFVIVALEIKDDGDQVFCSAFHSRGSHVSSRK